MTLAAIIPAAGESRRMGRHKLLLPWQNGTVMDAVLETWKESPVDEIFVVIRPEDDPLRDLCAKHGAHIVCPQKPTPDMKGSIQCGLRALQEKLGPVEIGPEKTCPWFLAPADMPWLSSQVIKTVWEAYQREPNRITLPAVKGKRGHPVLFPGWAMAEVFALRKEEGVNTLQKRNDCQIIPIDDPNVLRDLDTSADYERALGEQTYPLQPDS